MRITRIDSFPLRYADTNDFGREKSTLLVRVTAAGGTEGWGEGVTVV